MQSQLFSTYAPIINALTAADVRDDDALLRISANVTGDFGNVTDLRLGAGLRG